MRLMRQRDAMTQEEGFHALLPHAHEHTQQLMDEFAHETDYGLRCWLLELLGEAKDPKTLPLFLEYLSGDDDMLRYWAIRGLKLLNTKEARRALWDAGV